MLEHCVYAVHSASLIKPNAHNPDQVGKICTYVPQVEGTIPGCGRLAIVLCVVWWNNIEKTRNCPYNAHAPGQQAVSAGCHLRTRSSGTYVHTYVCTCPTRPCKVRTPSGPPPCRHPCPSHILAIRTRKISRALCTACS